jgi:hypothetical protein
MVIGWLVTTFVGENTLMPSPTLAEPLSSSSEQAVRRKRLAMKRKVERGKRKEVTLAATFL